MKTNPFSLGRRRTLGLIAGSAASLAARPLAAAAAAPGEPLLARPIPSSGEMLPVLGLGTSRSFDIGAGEASLGGAREVLRLFAEGGARLVDSSPMYGRAESVIGDFARELGLGSRLFYATKVWTRGQSQGVQQMLESYQRMGVARMDLMQVHNLLDVDNHLATLRGWKERGMLRYIGVTHYHRSAHAELEPLMRRGGLDFVQFNYSLAEREAEQRLLPLAAERGIAVIINRPFARGNLFGRVRGKPLPPWAADFDAASWAQFFLKFILGHPAVTCAIPATNKPKHLLDNLAAGHGRLPDQDTRQRMAALMDSL